MPTDSQPNSRRSASQIEQEFIMSQLPVGWEIKQGKEISLKITKGQSPKWQGFDYQDTGTLFVTSENVRDGKLDISKPKYLPLAFNEKLKGSKLKKDDILMNIVGASIGRSCQFDIDEANANINQAVCLFRPSDLVLSCYILQFLQLPTTIAKLLETQSSSARPNLTLEDIREFNFLLPPLPEQIKIAKILSTWDNAITTTEQLLTNSQQQKKALMQQLLTGNKRFVGFEGEWENKLLGETSFITTGSSNRQDSNLNGKYTFFDRSEDIRTSDRFLFDTEAVIVPGEGQAFVPKYFIGKFDLHQRTYAIINFKECAGKYIYYLLTYFTNYLLSQAVGSTVKSLRLPMFQKMPLTLPTLQEQQKIASVLSTADQEIETLQQKLNCLKQEKKALMQQLLTGKRRVKI